MDAGKSSFTMKKTVSVPSTLPLRPCVSCPNSLPYPWLHISLYFGLPIRCLYSIISPVSLSNTALRIWCGKVLDASVLVFIATSLITILANIMSWVRVRIRRLLQVLVAGVVLSALMLRGVGRIGRLLMVGSSSWVMVGMKSSLGSSFWVIVGLAPSSDATNACGYATIKFFFCGGTLGDGAEIGIGVKIFSFALGRATISDIALVSSFCCSYFDCVVDCCGASTLGVGIGGVVFIPNSLVLSAACLNICSRRCSAWVSSSHML